MSDPRFKTCFISAPVRTDTSVLRQALERRGIRWSDAVSIRPSGSILETIESGIAEADFVCVIVPKAPESISVFFEMGLALGKQRPVLAFIEPRVPIPSYFEGFTIARTALQDSEALNLNLDAFLSHAQPRKIKGTLSSRSRPKRVDTSWTKKALKSVQSKSGPLRAVEFERFVAKLLEGSGAQVSVANPLAGRGADMAVWVDELQPSIGNPLLVEVKSGRLSEARLHEGEQQLRHYLSHINARMGLLVYWDSEGRRFTPRKHEWPLVIRFSVEELISLVEKGQVVQAILRERNQLVHGAN